VRSNAERCNTVAPQLAGAGRIFVVGVGTSFHAAQAGEYLLRAYAGGVEAWGVHSFDFALYPPALRPDDWVIGVSHRGDTTYTVLALEVAHAAGCPTALITGTGFPERRPTFVEHVFETVGREDSATYTVSYIGTLAILAQLAATAGAERAGERAFDDGFLTETMPAIMHAALATEESVAALAREHVDRRRIVFVGGGPAGINAPEAALKILESSYLAAQGMLVEQMMHGPFQAADPDDLFVVIAPSGPAQQRCLAFARQVVELGAALIVLSDGSVSELREHAAGWIDVPSVPEPFTVVSCLIPLQLFAYQLALAAGTNPDAFHLNDERFMAAFKLIKL
jgi:glucosamine--fructose-6-phosphate aminotransferase (isomerizing)